MKSKRVFFLAMGLAVSVSSFFDSQICLMVENLPASPLMDFYRNLTDLGKAYFYIEGSLMAWLLLAVLSRWSFDFKEQKAFAKFSFFTFAITGLLTGTVKFFVGRARPNVACSAHEWSPITFDHIFQSFPSGHTQTVFTFALLISLRKPTLRSPAFLFAVLIACTRIARNVHYLSDILGGMMVAVAGLWISRALFQIENSSSDEKSLKSRISVQPEHAM